MSNSLQWQRIEHDAFVAEFPGEVCVEDVVTGDEMARTCEVVAEVDPFGVFAVRTIEMSADPFLAVGGARWLQVHGGWLVRAFGDRAPEVVGDELSVEDGVAVRALVVRISYEGPCTIVARVMAACDEHVGRIVVAYAVVDADDGWERDALRFVEGVRMRASLG